MCCRGDADWTTKLVPLSGRAEVTCDGVAAEYKAGGCCPAARRRRLLFGAAPVDDGCAPCD